MSTYGITNCLLCHGSFTKGAYIYKNIKCDHRICLFCVTIVPSSITCYATNCNKRIGCYDWKVTTFRSYSSTTIKLNNTSLASSWSNAGHESNKARLHTIPRTNYSGHELGLTSTCITNRTARWRLEVNNVRERELTLTFQPPLNIHDFTRCNIYKNVGFDTWMVILREEVVISEDSFCVKGLEPNELYKFKVEAILKNGEEITASTRQIKTSNAYVPFSPTNLKAVSATEYEISLAWDPPRYGSNPISYIIEREMKDGMGWELIKEINASMTSYCVTDLEPETLYCFRIMSANEKGKGSADYLHFKTESLNVPKPTDLQVLDKTPTEVMLRWSVPNVDKRAFGFNVKVTDTKTGNCTLRTELSNNEILVKDLKPDCRYEICVASTIKGRSSSFAKLFKKTKPSEVEPKHKRSAITTNKRVTDEKQYTEKEPVAKMQELKDDENKNIYLRCKETKEEKNMKADLAHSKLKGIPNIGSACYANCILQVLGQTPNLVPSLQYMEEQFSNIKKLPISSMLLTILQKFECDDGMYVDTRLIQDLITEMHSIDPLFGRFRQNDCHSFLMCLFNVIQDEISSAQGELKNKMTKNPFEMFKGKMCNYCELPCNHSETTEDQVFTSLLVPIQENRTNGQQEQWSIEKGLQLMMGSEEFDGEALPCLKCENKGLTSSGKKITRKTFGISEPPAILILQLGRFREVRGRLRKVDCDITYETYLDIEVINHRTQIPACLKYELYSVVLHYGSIENGHYYSYVKSITSGQWFTCSDRYVEKVQDPFKRGFREAYLLFFRRLYY